MRFTTQLDLPRGEESIAVPDAWTADQLLTAPAYRLLVIVTYLTAHDVPDHWAELRQLWPADSTDQAIRLLLQGLTGAGYLAQHGDDFELVHPEHRLGPITPTEV